MLAEIRNPADLYQEYDVAIFEVEMCVSVIERQGPSHIHCLRRILDHPRVTEWR